MATKLKLTFQIVASTLMMYGSASTQQQDGSHVQTPTIPLCELLQNPSKYSGKTVTTTARIDGFKERTDTWDPACRGRGADLHIADSARSSPSIAELNAALRKHGMGDYPLIATVTGTLLPNQREEHAFLLQPRLVFLVSGASEIHHSTKIERR
jgi:hypothetical protein